MPQPDWSYGLWSVERHQTWGCPNHDHVQQLSASSQSRAHRMAGGWRWGRCVRLQGAWCEGKYEGRSRMVPKRTLEAPMKEESGITYLLNGDETDLFHAFWVFLRNECQIRRFFQFKEAKISKVSSGWPFGGHSSSAETQWTVVEDAIAVVPAANRGTSKFAAKLPCDTYQCQHRYGRTYVGRDRAIPKFHAYVFGCPRSVEPLPLKLTIMPVVPEYGHRRSPAKVRARDVSV
jgi:hypothetical protein